MHETAQERGLDVRRVSFEGALQSVRQWEPCLEQARKSRGERRRILELRTALQRGFARRRQACYKLPMDLSLTKVHAGRRLTWRGWLLAAAVCGAGIVAAVSGLYPFLAPDAPPHEGLMVVEGWIHDFALDEAVALYRQGNYSRIACTGVPIETGSYIQQYKSYPEMTAARLAKLGIPRDQIVVAVSEDSRRDRTYLSAVALREAIIAYNLAETDLHLVTTGPHGRRSRMLFRKALGKDYRIGVTCLEEADYAPGEWYRYSHGVRSVVGELIAYLYALCFKP